MQVPRQSRAYYRGQVSHRYLIPLLLLRCLVRMVLAARALSFPRTFMGPLARPSPGTRRSEGPHMCRSRPIQLPLRLWAPLSIQLFSISLSQELDPDSGSG